MNESRVALILPSLVGGGAERVGSDLANHWVDQGRNVSVITIDAVTEAGFPLDARIHRVGLGLLRDSRSLGAKFWNNIHRVRRLRKAIQDASAGLVVSLTDITNVTTLLACRPLGVGVVVCERTDPRKHRIGSVWSWLREKSYAHARGIVVQTRGVRDWVQSKGWNVPVYVIANAAPVWREPSGTTIGTARTNPTIVGLGRLSREKGFDALIESFAEVADRHPEWRLCIYGEGSERPHLEDLAKRLNVDERVAMPGWTTDVENALRGGDMFVLPSHYEGFPNALLEAMAAGLACVSFDCDSGPREIIRDGVDGLLVAPGNVHELAESLHRLMSDESLRRTLAARALEVKDRFSRDAYYRQWDEVLVGDPPNTKPPG